ncbi:MAG: class I SAM-dependent methyltransferase, partial [Rivularia sp. (in: cyanobacteria)]
MSPLTLTEALEKIDQTFGIDKILSDFDRNFMVRYYTQSEIGYRTYHSEQDCVHMALNEDGVFNTQGYYAQPKTVETHLQSLNAKQVLELGCGKGFNSVFLADRNPETMFTGIDLTPLHVKIAQKKAVDLKNLSFMQGDFNHLPFADGQFDVVFAVECLCHSTNVPRTLAEIYRVLRPGGRLVVFDGYRSAEFENQEASLRTAQKLTEVAMAVQDGMNDIDNWSNTSSEVGFKLLESADLSQAIKPTVYRLQQLSAR